MAAALDSVVLLSSSETPPIVTQPATPGVPLSAACTSLTVACVRASEAALGSCTPMIAKP